MLGREAVRVAAPQVHHRGPRVRYRLKQRARGSHSSVVLVTLWSPPSAPADRWPVCAQKPDISSQNTGSFWPTPGSPSSSFWHKIPGTANPDSQFCGTFASKQSDSQREGSMCLFRMSSFHAGPSGTEHQALSCLWSDICHQTGSVAQARP